MHGDNTSIVDGTIKSASYNDGDSIDGDFYLLDVELDDGSCECVIVDGESRIIRDAISRNGGDICQGADILTWVGKAIKVQKISNKYSSDFRLKDAGDIAKLISEAEESGNYGTLKRVAKNYYRPEQPSVTYRFDSGKSGKKAKRNDKGGSDENDIHRRLRALWH